MLLKADFLAPELPSRRYFPHLKIPGYSELMDIAGKTHDFKRLKRSIIPAAIAVSGTIISQIFYNQSVNIRNAFLNDLFLWTGFFGMILFTFLSPLLVYIFAYLRGAKSTERILAALAAPVVKYFLIFSSFFGIFPAAEVALLLIHHVVLAPLVFGFFEIGLASIACHGISRVRKKDRTIRVFLRKESIFLILGIFLFTLFFWELGHFYYYWFLDLYIRIFG